MRLWHFPVGLALLLLTPAPIAAQASGTDEEARALFTAGSVAFDEGRYESALEYFQRSYDLSQRPQLLYNIGVTAERLRRDDAALAAFRRFLVEVPDAPQRAAVEARVAILERALAEREQPRAAAPQDVPAATPEPRATPDPTPVDPTPADPTGPIVLISGGAVLAVAGAILLGVAVGDVSSIENAPRGTSWASVADAYSRSEALSIAGGVGAGVGVALAAAGLVWIALPGGASGEQASLRVRPGLGGLWVGGSF